MKSGEFILKYRWLIIILSVVIPVIIGLQIFRAEIDPDLEQYIPSDMPSRINTQAIADIFGGDELLILIFETDDVLNPETLERIKSIRKELNRMDEVAQVMSIFDVKNLKNEGGMLVSESFLDVMPQTDEEIESLRNDLTENQMAKDVVVSGDFTLATIILSLVPEATANETVHKVETIISENPGNEKVYLGGLPYMNSVISGEIAGDMKRLMIIGLVIMLIMLYVFLKDIRGVLLPFSVVILSIIFSLGFLPLIGWKMSVITLLLPVMLIAIANNYGIHLISKYQEIIWSDGTISNGKLVKKIYSNLRIPIFLTGITTVAGFMSLMTHKMIPARQLGIISSIGIILALTISLLFIPAVLSILKKSNIARSQKNGNKRVLDRLLEKVAGFIAARPLRILIITACVVIASGAGIFLLKVDTDVEKFFPSKHPVRKSSEIINRVFGGSQNLAVHFNGDLMDPEIMKRIDNYTEGIKNVEGVGNVMSISSVIREISKAMNNPGDELYDAIPESRDAIAQYLLLYSMNGNPEDLEKLIDFNYENAQIMIRITDGSNATIHSVMDEVHRMTDGDPNFVRVGGYGYVVAQLAGMVVRGQVSSLLLAFILCAIILSIAFRSGVAGLFGSIPLMVSLVILFGLMGYFGIYLDIATALLSSIMIGVGIDYTIHFLYRYKQERLEGLNAQDAVIKTLTTTGRGITFNAISVMIGFCALPFSSFTPIKFFGFLVIISIFTCLVGALVIIPSLVLVVKPKFLEAQKLKSPVSQLKKVAGGLRPKRNRQSEQTEIPDQKSAETHQLNLTETHQLNLTETHQLDLTETHQLNLTETHQLDPAETHQAEPAENQEENLTETRRLKIAKNGQEDEDTNIKQTG